MSYLQPYVRQVKPRNESYIPPVDKIQSFLAEGSAADATNGEKAICFAYNHFIQGMDEEKALSLAKIEKRPTGDKWKALIKVGEKVVAHGSFKAGKRGDFLIHAGTSTAPTNYERGSDKTSKSDLYGSNDTSQNISLKKQGDKGEGAQLMSAKAGEAEGVFKAAIAHYENAGGTIADTKVFKDAMNILENQMETTSSNKLNVEVGSGIKDFGTWYVENSTRAKDLRSKYRTDRKIKDKDIVNFLKGELSLIGAARQELKNDQAYVDKLPKETPITKKDLDKYTGEYVKDTQWNVGGAPKGRTDKDKGVKVSAYHFYKGGKEGTSTDWAAGVTSDVFKSEALKKQVKEVIDTAIKNKEWQEKLSEFFSENKELKKWMVYEAASGLYKFTGNVSDGNAYPGTKREVANKILVFSDNGFVKEHENLVTYAGNNIQLVDNVVVAYKGSGRSKFSAVRIFSSYEPESKLPLLEQILDGEMPSLQQEIYQIERECLLSEGIFRGAINKMKKFASKVSDLLKKFYEKVIKKFMTLLLELAKKGITKFLEALGLEIEGEVSMKTPSW